MRCSAISIVYPVYARGQASVGAVIRQQYKGLFHFEKQPFYKKHAFIRGKFIRHQRYTHQGPGYSIPWLVLEGVQSSPVRGAIQAPSSSV